MDSTSGKLGRCGRHTQASLGRRVYHGKGVISATLREILGRRTSPPIKVFNPTWGRGNKELEEPSP